MRPLSAAPASGNQKFNVVSLVEAADTGPFFHNNSAATIEGTVHFYTTTDFDPEPFKLEEAPQVIQLAAFLRALNALENIRSSNELGRKRRANFSRRGRRSGSGSSPTPMTRLRC